MGKTHKASDFPAGAKTMEGQSGACIHYAFRNEYGQVELGVRVHGYDYEPDDVDGVTVGNLAVDADDFADFIEMLNSVERVN